MNHLLALLIWVVYYLEKWKMGRFMRFVLYLILNHILRYRHKVIYKNLVILYPSASLTKLKQYKSDYCRHMADLIVETLWCFRASKEELKSKIRLKNPDLLESIHERNENVTFLLSHIGNWELFCQWAGMFTPKFKVPILYTPIKNRDLNTFVLKLRQRTGNILVSTKSTLELFRLQHTKPTCVNLFAIDQNPGDPDNQHWLKFFGLTVPVISGAEKFAKSQNQKTYFIYVTKSDVYELELIEIEYNASKPFDLTEKQFELLKKNILENPSLWLLSHNRFKYGKYR